MKTLLLTAAVSLAAVTASSGTAGAASPYHVDALAVQVQREAVNVARFLGANYRNHPRYGHLYNDALAMYRQAGHVHAVVHTGGSRSHVAHDVRELDRSLHHMRDIVAEMSNDLRRHVYHEHRYGVGHGPGAVIRIGHGAVIQFGAVGGAYGLQHNYEHGELRTLSQLQQMLASMEQTVHHLQDDVRGW